MKRAFLHCFVIILLTFGPVLAFDYSYSEWNLANYNGTYATFNNGFITVVDGGSDYWHIQLFL